MIKNLIALAVLALAGAAIAQNKNADSCKDCKGEKMVAQTTPDGKAACCKSTQDKPVAKGEKGCCNAKGELAKFKVWVANEGYKFYGCEGSAKQGREELVAQGYTVGTVQKVSSKVAM